MVNSKKKTTFAPLIQKKQIMPTRIRLQRHGKKGAPIYHIVIADSRAPRDGRFIEKIGVYNPLTRPASIEINFDRALYWLQTGAQPSDTARAILSFKGVVYKNHLLKGVTKGAMTLEQAETKFQNWLTEKNSKIQGQIREMSKSEKDELQRKLDAEAKVREKRAQLIAEKNAAAQQQDAPAEEEPVVEEETPVAEENTEAPADSTENTEN